MSVDTRVAVCRSDTMQPFETLLVDGTRRQPTQAEWDAVEKLDKFVENAFGGHLLTVFLWKFGSQYYPHSEVIPAVVLSGDIEIWMKKGKIHRADGGPAMVRKAGKRRDSADEF